MAGALGRDHKDVYILGRLNLAEMDVETMREEQSLSRLEVRLNVLFINSGLVFIRQQNHDQVSLFGCFSGGNRFKTVFLGQCIVGAAGALPDNDINPGIPQILGMSMALAAIAENGDGLAFEHRKVGILIIIGFHGILRMVNRNARRNAARSRKAICCGEPTLSSVPVHSLPEFNLRSATLGA